MSSVLARLFDLLLDGEKHGTLRMDNDGRVLICADGADDAQCLVAPGGEDTLRVASEYFKTFGYDLIEAALDLPAPPPAELTEPQNEE